MEFDDKELVHLARLALDGKTDDVAMLIRRIARKLRNASPETASALVKLAKRRERDTAARGASVAHMPVDLETRLELAKVEQAVSLQNDPIWQSGVEASLRQVVSERQNEEVLAQAELHPARSLLFVGPPGVGKTLSARWIASQLKMPLITLDLAAVMSSFLGRTGNNLRNVLDYAKDRQCILLLDEFDAIAKRRDDAIEVGELKRLVTVLLQEIDNWPATGILIAATNHPELLDPAIWRRFEVVVMFDLPESEALRRGLDRMLGDEARELKDTLAIVMAGVSFSDIERELRRARRQAVLSKKTLIESLDGFIKDHLSKQKLSCRKAVAKQLMDLGYSQRRVNDLTRVSRDTMRTEAFTNRKDEIDA